MKKILLSIFAVGAFVAAAHAQTQQGSMIVGGNVSFNFEKEKAKSGSTTVDLGKSTNIMINPQFGYFIIDGLAAGLDLNLSTYAFKPDQGGTEFNSTYFAVGPFVKYYHESGFFGLGNFGIGSSKSKSTNNAGVTNESTRNISSWRLGGGYAVFLNDNVSLEPMLSYGGNTLNYKDMDPEYKETTSGLQISVGFHIFL